MRFLKTGLFNTVRMEDGQPPTPVRPWYGRFLCPHNNIRYFLRVDHRSGPGWMADNYQGRSCGRCGRILNERKTY